ncbi:hypothetical protein ABIE50_002450 [Chitinophaga sp. OAE865]
MTEWQKIDFRIFSTPVMNTNDPETGLYMSRLRLEHE